MTVEHLLSWSRRRLEHLSRAGIQEVAVEVDLDGLSELVSSELDAVVEAAGFKRKQTAPDRIFLSPRRQNGAGSPFHCHDYWLQSTAGHLVEVERFRRRLLELRAAGRVVLFIGLKHHNTPSINYLAAAMRESEDVRVCAIFLHEPPAAGVFDEALYVHGALGLVYAAVKGLPPLPVYVQAHAKWAFLGLWIKRINRGLRVCQEIYDFTALFVPPERASVFAEHGVYSLPDIAMSRWAEMAAVRCLDGMFYKNGGPPMRELLGVDSHRAVPFTPAPPRRWMRPVQGRVDVDTRSPRLVYAGQIKGGANAPVVFGDMYYLPLARDLIQQGCTLDIFWPVRDARGRLRDEFAEYADESRTNPRFMLRDGLPTEQLIERLAGQYDFGLILYYFEPDLAVGRAHLESALASKLFTYIAAGLPVVVSAEFKYMAGLVEKLGVGLVLRREEIPSLVERLESVDYSGLREGVRAAQQNYFMEANVPRVLAALFPESHSSHTLSASR